MDWNEINRTLQELVALTRGAANADECRSVGVRCRELLVSIAQTAFDPDRHLPEGAKIPGRTDSKAMLDFFLESELKGSSNEEARRFARAAVQLADAVTHKRPARPFDAGVAAIATESVARLIGFLAGTELFVERIPWSGVGVRERFFAWDGPNLHALNDRPGIAAPSGLIEAIRAKAMDPSFGLREDLDHYFSRGKSQVFETDRVSWRREILHQG